MRSEQLVQFPPLFIFSFRILDEDYVSDERATRERQSIVWGNVEGKDGVRVKSCQLPGSFAVERRRPDVAHPILRAGIQDRFSIGRPFNFGDFRSSDWHLQHLWRSSRKRIGRAHV